MFSQGLMDHMARGVGDDDVGAVLYSKQSKFPTYSPGDARLYDFVVV